MTSVLKLLHPNSHHLGSVSRDGGAGGKLLSWRLHQLGLDPAYVKMYCASAYQDLERVCASCECRQHCAENLAQGDVESGMQGYCPNALTIDALIVD